MELLVRYSDMNTIPSINKGSPAAAFLSSPQELAVRRERSGGLGFRAVLSVEFFDATGGVDDLLLTGVKRVASGTDFDM
jgi:hypothetical protein